MGALVVVRRLAALIAALVSLTAPPIACGDQMPAKKRVRPVSVPTYGYIPVAPAYRIVQGRAPNVPADAISAAQTDLAHHAIYYTGTDPGVRGHELGHMLDYEVLTNGDRRYFQRHYFADVGPGAWNRGTGATAGGLTSPNERFADWYMNAALGNDPSNAWQSAYAPAPDPRMFRQFVAALQRLGRRHNLKPYGS